MEFTKGYETLYVESCKGGVEFLMVDEWTDNGVRLLLSYSEWDELVNAVEEYRAKEKENV